MCKEESYGRYRNALDHCYQPCTWHLSQMVPVPANAVNPYGEDEEIYSISTALAIQVKYMFANGVEPSEIKAFVRQQMHHNPDLTEKMLDRVLVQSDDFELREKDYERLAEMMERPLKEIKHLLALYEATKAAKLPEERPPMTQAFVLNEVKSAAPQSSSRSKRKR